MIKNKNKVKNILILIFISIAEYYQSYISCNLKESVQVITTQCVLLNISVLLILNLIIYLGLNRLWLTMIISESLWTIISIVNYYVIQYHGMPLTVSELKNFKTALNLVGSYTINIDAAVIKILLIFGISLIYCIYDKKAKTSPKRSVKNIILPITVLLICSIYILIGLYAENPIKPKKTIGWSWEEAYGKYGYILCTMEDFNSKNNIINKPENYNDTDVERVCNKYLENKETAENNHYPDIIFIVNETFYDLKHIVDFETDTDYLKNINNMDLIKGYAVAPSSGGGTNSSEYELLTSNSLYLMQGITPFNVIDLEDASSIVSHLNNQGYTTLGTHTEPAINYNRITGYNDLGFDNIKFDDEYIDLEYYYGRWYETDSSVYKNIEAWYSEMGDNPRFLYLLTIQNHGGYDLLEPENYTVHVTDSDFEMTDTVNEYLTSISLSDEAFFELTEYFKNVDRDVIICMVGDHSPSFAKDIVNESLREEEKSLRLRETPLYIWANFEIEKREVGSVGMPFVAPLLLDIAGVPLSAYYEYLLDVNEQIPIITSYGKYYDADNNCFSFDEGVYSNLISEWLNIEYNNIGNDAKRINAFFE